MSKQMKLSEAIREGAKLRPQAFGVFFADNIEGATCSCALGAAYEFLFGLPKKNKYLGLRVPGDELEDTYPHLNIPFLKSSDWLCNTIAELNDKEKKTREQIADWLEEKGY